LFSYIANYIYEGDAPLAERRAQALSIDQSQLEQILGSVDFRELLDKTALDEVEAQLQSREPEYQARHADGVHDLLLKLGDLTADEVAERSATPAIASTVQGLVKSRRAVQVRIGGETRFIPVEYAARYRDGVGTPLPPGLAETFLQPVADPLAGILRRYARTHGPFTTAEVGTRYGLAASDVETVLRAIHAEGKLLEGEFRPGGIHSEWCEPAVLQSIRRKTLARLRREVVPAEQSVFTRFLGRWHGVTTPRKGLDALLDAIEILQGVELIASDLESEILPARVAGYQTADLDALLAAGEIVWVGRESLGNRDGRISLYLAEAIGPLISPGSLDVLPDSLSDRAVKIWEFLRGQGASFEATIHAAMGGFANETTDAIWELTWSGLITNDTYQPIRSLVSKDKARARREYFSPGSPGFTQRFRSRRSAERAGQGRWSLVEHRIAKGATVTEWSAAVAQQMLVRNGIVMRETAAAENVRGGYPVVYAALKTMEESGWIRRGMFVAGMGAAQFATPAAVDMLRSLRHPGERLEVVHLAASDPANPYGSLLPWAEDANHSMSRAAGGNVILVNGRLVAFFRRRNPAWQIFLPEDERTHFARELAQKLARVAIRHQGRRSGMLITTMNDVPAGQHFLGRYLEESGFALTALGFQMRRVHQSAVTSAHSANEKEVDAQDENAYEKEDEENEEDSEQSESHA
jgi:ATP-dependent Lhr-like helicase